MKNIAAALVKAQRGFAPALKTNTNPHFRSKYVALDGCIESVIDALNANGIMLMQPTHECEHGVTVETLFIHESGEVFSGGKLHVPASKNDAQGYGSALTYARRYSLMAACGIAPEDDDGNAASKRPQVVAASFRSSPTMGEMDSLPKDQQEYLRDLAVEIAGYVAEGNADEAYTKVESEHLDDAQKTALWGILDSKTRAAIKKAGQAMREAA